jgi:SET domain-containing protein
MPDDSSPPPLFEVRQSEIHNRGVFAACDIQPGQRILEYVGEKITKRESNRRALELVERAKQTGEAAVYIFTLNSRYDIDGAHGDNPARYINHSCDPNCEVFIERGRIWVYAKKFIRQGAELTFNYGFDIDTWDEHPCRCGTDRCVGFIVAEEQWPRLKRKLTRLRKSMAAHAAARQS